MPLEDVRTNLESFELETSKEYLEHSTGRKLEMESAKIYDKYPGLFSLENVKNAQRETENASGLLKRRNLYLLGALVNGFMAEPVKELSDERDTFEAKAMVSIDGKDAPFRHVGVLISNTPEHGERKRLFELSLPVKKRLMEFDKRLLEAEWVAAKQAGYPDYTSVYAQIKECDYDTLAADARRFLIETDKMYTGLIRKAMASIGVPLGQAESFDVSFWIRNPRWDSFFPKEGLVKSLKNTLKGLGLDLDRQSNIMLDVEDRPAKVPRAFCMPLRVPEEVHLVIKPSGGQNDYKSLFHEAGHSEHYANTDANLEFEFKHLGSHCVSETYAFTFEHIIMTKEWLSRHTSMNEAEIQSFLEFDMTVKLFFLRRYAAKLLYELKLHRQDLRVLDSSFAPAPAKTYPDMAACYSDVLSRAVKVKIHPVAWASDVDGGYYCADYLRAWILEAQLKEHLKKRFGPAWVEDKEAGKELRSLWKEGNRPSPEELSKRFGFPRIGMDILEKEVKAFFLSA